MVVLCAAGAMVVDLLALVSVVVGGHLEELLGTVRGTEQLNFAAVMERVSFDKFDSEL